MKLSDGCFISMILDLKRRCYRLTPQLRGISDYIILFPIIIYKNDI